jgi:hypothetical protein
LFSCITQVASVDEFNNQQIFHHPYIIYMPFIYTIKINNLHNDMWQMKKVWKKNVSKINSGSSLSILYGFNLWHVA